MAKKVELYKLPNSNRQDERIDVGLKLLGLEGMRKSYQELANHYNKVGGTLKDFLDSLNEKECEWRNENLRQRRLQKAKFPIIRALEDFDFNFPSFIDRRKVNEAASLRFIDKKTNVIFLGAHGLGKTHLSIALGIKAIENGKDVFFVRMDQLIEQVNRIADVESLHRLFRSLVIPQLLVLDDWDVYKVNEKASSFLVKLIQERYKKGSIIISSNGTFSDWDVLFGNVRIAGKIIDRLTDDAEIILIEGNSHRNKDRLGDRQSPIKTQAPL